MSREDKVIVYGILAVVAVIVGGVLWNGWKDRQIVEAVTARVVAEEKVKQLAKDYVARDKYIDSVETLADQRKAVIEYQQKNPNIIIEKYEKVHSDIDNLSNSQSFELFAKNLQSYKNNIERYRLYRFKRGN